MDAFGRAEYLDIVWSCMSRNIVTNPGTPPDRCLSVVCAVCCLTNIECIIELLVTIPGVSQFPCFLQIDSTAEDANLGGSLLVPVQKTSARGRPGFRSFCIFVLFFYHAVVSYCITIWKIG